jgi:hypothetical protein
VMATPIAKSILRPEIKPRIRHTRSFVDVCSMSASLYRPTFNMGGHL